MARLREGRRECLDGISRAIWGAYLLYIFVLHSIDEEGGDEVEHEDGIDHDERGEEQDGEDRSLRRRGEDGGRLFSSDGKQRHQMAHKTASGWQPDGNQMAIRWQSGGKRTGFRWHSGGKQMGQTSPATTR